MFCPNCRAEYRAGFAQCSDCEVNLVESLPAPGPEKPEAIEDQRPDLAPTHVFLAWLMPMCVFVILCFGACVRPVLMRNLYFHLLFYAAIFREYLWQLLDAFSSGAL
jgi:hypothetical protein